MPSDKKCYYYKYNSILPFRAAFHHLSRWMCWTRDPEEKWKTYWAPVAAACSQACLPLGVSLDLLNRALWLVSSYCLASVQLQPAQSGSKQIHKSFVYTLTWAFPIRSWESSWRRDSQTLRVQLSGTERKSFFMGAFCVYDTTTSIDGELFRRTKSRLWQARFVVPLASHDSLHRMTH